jgi:hypothetical protein
MSIYSFVNKERAKVAKTKRKKGGKKITIKKACQNRSKAAEYVGNLLELHKLQGVLLNRLDKEV